MVLDNDVIEMTKIFTASIFGKCIFAKQSAIGLLDVRWGCHKLRSYYYSDSRLTDIQHRDIQHLDIQHPDIQHPGHPAP